MIESFAGLGTTAEQATAEVRQNFIVNSFPVVLAAFFAPYDEQITREEWMIGGQKRQVVLGNIGDRGTLPEPREQSLEWFKLFEEKVKAKTLTGELHWLRLYYAQMQSQPQVCEVLLPEMALIYVKTRHYAEVFSPSTSICLDRFQSEPEA